MTQKQKAKAYDVILEKANKIYHSPKDALINNINLTNEGSVAAIRVALIELFNKNELTESENERIRRELIDFLYSASHPKVGLLDSETFIKWRDYLKKQKEQKPSTEETELNSLAFLEQLGYTCIPPSEQKPGKCVGCNNVKGCINCVDGDQWAHIEEQKPADFFPNQFDGIIYGMEGHSTDKPAKWSEEDNGMLEELIADYKFLCEKFSKEEKDFFIKCSYAKDENEMLSWLNSLPSRSALSHWKPSEEQMDWLATAVRLSADKPSIHKVIASLYNDLKKL